jgi:hypothetical protein
MCTTTGWDNVILYMTIMQLLIKIPVDTYLFLKRWCVMVLWIGK